MGKYLSCCKKEIEDTSGGFAEGEAEISFPEYQSTSDEYFTLIENKYNIFKDIQIVEYMNLLESFSIQTATTKFEGTYRYDFKSTDEFLNTTFHQDEFQSFIENKLLNIPEILELYGEDEQTIALFKEIFLKIFSALNVRLNSFYKDDTDNKNKITKLNLIPFGILFCRSKNVSKMKLFFDLFKNEENYFIKSDRLDNYLITSFFISSYCLVSVRSLIDNKEKNLEKIDKREIQMLLTDKGLVQKNCENLLKYFNDNFFDKKDKLNWEEFKKKFTCDDSEENSFAWIFSTQGIRNKLESKNIMNL